MASQRLDSQLLTGGNAHGEVLAFHDQLGWHDQVVDVVSDRLVFGIAEHRRELSIDPDYVVVFIEDGDRLGGVLEECGEIDVLRLQRIVKAFAIGDVDRDSDRPGDPAVRRAYGLDSRLEGSSSPVRLVTNQLALESAEMRREWGETGVSRLEDFVQRHADLLGGAGADQVQSGALREGDVELRIGGPQIDRHRLEHEAESLVGISGGRARTRWRLGRSAAYPP